MLERQIRCFPYGERPDVPRLQQVEQKAIGRQRNLGLCIYVTQPVSPVKQELFTISVHLSSYLILVGFISFGCVVLHTCQVTRFCRVTHGNRACHPHFPEHPSGHGFHYDDPELVQILEIFIYSENTRILPIERTTIRMVNCNQQQYTFEVLSN